MATQVTNADSATDIGKRFRPFYIHDQGWRLLLDSANARKHLQSQNARGPSADGQALMTVEQERQIWMDIEDHCDLALDQLQNRDGEHIPVQYVAITTDAGIGKTKATQWLEYRLSCPDSPYVAFRLRLSELIEQNRLGEANFSEELMRFLAGKWVDHSGETAEFDNSLAYLKQARQRGTLVLILDELDQLAGNPSLVTWIIRSPIWQRVRMFIAGRPNSIKSNWDDLFKDRPWHFVVVEDFDEGQQDRFLGPIRDQIPEHALASVRQIMRNPRVLEYFLELEDFSKIKNAADVYYYAIRNMVRGGILKSASARRNISPVPREDRGKADPSQIATAMALLAAIAFESLIFRQHPPTWNSDRVPSRPEDKLTGKYDYSEHVNPVEEYNEFRLENLQPRWQQMKFKDSVDDNLRGLAALNVILEGGLFDTELEGLDQVRFSNRSLHEFLVAFYFARYATDLDFDRLWDWIYIKDNGDTEEYYYVWQYLCEMTFEARKHSTWLRSVSMLYKGCQCDESIPESAEPKPGEKTRYFAKRSTEMIFRSWSSFDRYIANHGNPQIREQAINIRQEWLDEFEKEIVDGKQGDDRKRAALELKRHLMPIPSGQFRMGTLPVKQGIAAVPEELIEGWRQRFENSIALERWADRLPWPPGRYGREHRQTFLNRIRRFVDTNDFEGLLNDRYPANETPKDQSIRTIEGFSLGRTMVSNQWYRVFDPGHGTRKSELWDDYAEISRSGDHPAIYLSWFDSFVLAKWLHWDGESCALPTEEQWEYAAKLGLDVQTQWHFRFWWGDDFDAERDADRLICWETRGSKTYHTAVPTAKQASPSSVAFDNKQIGLCAMLGNVWEWCQDEYCGEYERFPSDDPGTSFSGRMLRGGSFNLNAERCTCSNRDNQFPANASHDHGVRVARAHPRTP